MFKKVNLLAWLSLMCLLFTQNTYGQKNYTEGYVLLPSQDTVKGYIDDQNWDRNPTFINFKKVVNGEPQKYTVSQLAGFSITNGDTYRKSIVKIDKTPTRFDELLRNPNIVEAIDTVFLLELVPGKMTLYHLNDEDHRHHFFVSEESGMVTELIQRYYIANKNCQQMLGISNQYKDQLRYSFLTKCPTLQPQIIKATYTKYALQSIIEQYNACINPIVKTGVATRNQPIAVKYQITAGANNTLYFFKGREKQYVEDMDYASGFNPLIGLSFQLIIPRNRQKWSILNELAWKKSSTKGTYQYTDRWIDEKSTINIKTNYLGLTTLLRYSWINKNYQPFINIGFAINRAINLDMDLQTHRNFYSYQTNYNGPYQADHHRNVEIGVVSGAGIKINKITGEIRYERANGFLDLSQLSVEKKMFQFLMSYTIN